MNKQIGAQEKRIRRMSRTGRTVLLGIWMLWGIVLTESPYGPR